MAAPKSKGLDKSGLYIWDDTNSIFVAWDGANTGSGGGSIITEAYDYTEVTTTNANGDPTQIVYKTGGSGGTTVATLDITYDGNGNTATITKT